MPFFTPFSSFFQILQDELSRNVGKVEDLRQLATDICINVSEFFSPARVAHSVERQNLWVGLSESKLASIKHLYLRSINASEADTFGPCLFPSAADGLRFVPASLPSLRFSLWVKFPE